MAKEKACKTCSRIVDGNICPACKGTDFSRTWRGMVTIFDPESEVAKMMGVTSSGRYAIEVK